MFQKSDKGINSRKNIQTSRKNIHISSLSLHEGSLGMGEQQPVLFDDKNQTIRVYAVQ